jgi:hypothetical protein
MKWQKLGGRWHMSGGDDAPLKARQAAKTLAAWRRQHGDKQSARGALRENGKAKLNLRAQHRRRGICERKQQYQRGGQKNYENQRKIGCRENGRLSSVNNNGAAKINIER